LIVWHLQGSRQGTCNGTRVSLRLMDGFILDRSTHRIARSPFIFSSKVPALCDWTFSNVHTPGKVHVCTLITLIVSTKLPSLLEPMAALGLGLVPRLGGFEGGETLPWEPWKLFSREGRGIRTIACSPAYAIWAYEQMRGRNLFHVVAEAQRPGSCG